MGSLRPRLMEAETPEARMDALCEFIKFWLGPRDPSYGEPPEALDGRPLPRPLRRLYEFAGRWPHGKHPWSAEYWVPAFSHQDHLMTLRELTDEDGRVIFLSENQAVWDCRTLPEGDDPPVWCHGDQLVEHGGPAPGGRLVCASLSRFLTSFVLQELALGSRLVLVDDGLAAQFEGEREAAIPVWTRGPYVFEDGQDYHLWRGVLVFRYGGGEPFLAANHDEAVAFLTANQGPINAISLRVYPPWSLDVRPDGSARMRYHTEETDERAEAPAGTFDFPGLLDTLSAAASDRGDAEENAMVSFFREGQPGGVFSRHLHDGGLVTSLFRRTLDRAAAPNEALERRFAAEWPL